VREGAPGACAAVSAPICGAVLSLLAAAAAAASPLPDSPAFASISTAELQANYDTLWAVSDVHGHRKQLEKLLRAAGIAVPAGAGVGWKPGLGRQVLIIVGDSFGGGPHSRGVVLLLKRLQEEAAGAGSRVIVLLGNWEAHFLGDPFRLRDDEVSQFIRAMPVAAVVGSWLFAHSGYIDAENDPDALRAYFTGIASSWAERRYASLLQRHSILEYHNWWRSDRRRSKLKKRLATLGLNGLVFGHDPDGLGARATLAVDGKGFLTKLDTGLKTGESQGMMLRCEVARLVRGGELAMTDAGKPVCRAQTPDGELREIPVR
jgi:hypothetical protein